jgi:mannose/cellobiose epimerase-like protein (N-acyl-D-glucosamine 2-epimerase family)
VVRYARQHERADLWEHYRQTMDHVKDNLIDHEHGGWFRSWYPDKERSERDLHKGNEWLSGYHPINLYLEALAP